MGLSLFFFFNFYFCLPNPFGLILFHFWSTWWLSFIVKYKAWWFCLGFKIGLLAMAKCLVSKLKDLLVLGVCLGLLDLALIESRFQISKHWQTNLFKLYADQIYIYIYIYISLKTKVTTAHHWCDGHSTSINACGMWRVRAGVQVSKRELHTHIHLY